jgi:hypothetical protein
MISADVLARTRLLLDEAIASYWTDDEVYSSLTDAQNAICGLALSVYDMKVKVSNDASIPFVLEPLHSVKTGTIALGINTTTLPLPILLLISLQYNPSATTPLYPVRMRNISNAGQFQKSNSYLGNVGTDYFATLTSNKVLTFETMSTYDYAGYSAEVISQPLDINSGTNPSIPDITQNALAYFAFSQLLAKDQRSEESIKAFNMFMQLSQPLVTL